MSLLSYYTRLARQSGYSVAKGVALPFVRKEAVRSGLHAMPYPVHATYSPWLGDEAFMTTYEAIRRNTLVGEWSCAELWSLVAEVRDVPGAIVEVGVWRGGTGALMAARAQHLGITDPVYLCDTWQGVVKTGAEDPYYHDGKHDDTSIEVVRALVGKLNLGNVELLQGIFPDDTADRVTTDAVRLCHIDVDVYNSAKDVFAWIWPRLSPGGVVVFDDYGGPATVGIGRFVDEQRMLADRIVIHNTNGHGIVIKRG
jgi:O-methyltransferase